MSIIVQTNAFQNNAFQVDPNPYVNLSGLSASTAVGTVTIPFVPSGVHRCVTSSGGRPQSRRLSDGSFVLVAALAPGGGTDYGMSITRYTSSGSMTWSRVDLPDISGFSFTPIDACVDSSDNIYVASEIQQQTPTATYVAVHKYNSAGTLQWRQRIFVTAQSTSSVSPTAIKTDGTRVYVTIAGGSYANGHCGSVALLASTGASSWSRIITTMSSYVIGGGNCVVNAANGDSYTAVQTDNAANDIHVAYRNSAGTLQWIKKLALTTADGNKISTYPCITRLSGGGLVVAYLLYDAPSGTYQLVVARTAADMSSVTWNVLFNDFPVATAPLINVDSNDNIYVVAGTFALKLNSSGTLSAALSLASAPNYLDTGFTSIEATPSGKLRISPKVDVGDSFYRAVSCEVDFASATLDAPTYGVTVQLVDVTSRITPSTIGLTASSTAFTDAAGAYTINSTFNPTLTEMDAAPYGAAETFSWVNPTAGAYAGYVDSSYGTGISSASVVGDTFVIATGDDSLTLYRHSLTGKQTVNQRHFNVATNVGGDIATDIFGATFAGIGGFIAASNRAWVARIGDRNNYSYGEVGALASAVPPSVATDRFFVYSAYASSSAASTIVVNKFDKRKFGSVWQVGVQVALDSYNIITSARTGIALDSSGNIYVAAPCSTGVDNEARIAVAKLSSSGTLLWWKYLADPRANIAGTTPRISVDASDRPVITFGIYGGSGSVVEAHLIVLTSDGASIAWQKTIASSYNAPKTACDASGNIYVCVPTSNTGPVRLTKFSSTGTVLTAIEASLSDYPSLTNTLLLPGTEQLLAYGSGNANSGSIRFVRFDTLAPVSYASPFGSWSTTSPSYSASNYALTSSAQALTSPNLTDGYATALSFVPATNTVTLLSPSAGTSDVTVGLSGLQALTAAGTVVATGGGTSVSVSGVAATTAGGALSVSRSSTLAGVQSTTATGSFGTSRTVAVSGTQSASQVGSLTAAPSKTLTGAALSSATGSFAAYDRALVLGGVASAIGYGSIAASTASSVSVGLAGLGATAALGTAVINNTPSVISGVSAVAQSGTLISTQVLVGRSAASAVGALPVGISKGLTGNAATTGVGALANNSSLALSGLAAAAATGITAPSSGVINVGLTGQAALAKTGAFMIGDILDLLTVAYADFDTQNDLVAPTRLWTVGNEATPRFGTKGLDTTFNNGTTFTTIRGMVESGPQVPAIGTKPFTIECWLYFAEFFNYNSPNKTNPIFGYSVQSGSRTLGIGFNSTAIVLSDFTTILGESAPSAIPFQQWVHIAHCRDEAGNSAVYVDGVQVISWSGDTQNITATNVIWANQFHTVNGWYGSGLYIDEARITHACRYNGNFTPPTAPWGYSTPSSLVGVQIGLTGQSATTAVGTVVATGGNLVLPLSGVAANSAVGSATTSRNLALTGAQAASGTGVVSTSSTSTLALTGVQAASSVGTLRPPVWMTGLAATASAGSVTASQGAVLTGRSANTGVGSITVSTTVSVSGAAAASASNVLPFTLSKGLTGNAAASAANTFSAKGITNALIGNNANVVQGVFSQQRTLPALTGRVATVGFGSLIPTIFADSDVIAGMFVRTINTDAVVRTESNDIVVLQLEADLFIHLVADDEVIVTAPDDTAIFSPYSRAA